MPPIVLLPQLLRHFLPAAGNPAVELRDARAQRLQLPLHLLRAQPNTPMSLRRLVHRQLMERLIFWDGLVTVTTDQGPLRQ